MSLISSTNQKITVSDIAAKACVSPATVSRVTNQRSLVKGETYAKVIKAMKQLGCYIDETDPVLTSPVGGLVVLNIPYFINPFYGEIVNGARASISRHGYSLLLNEGAINYETIDNYKLTIKQNKIVGIITMSSIETSVLKHLSDVTQVVQCGEYNEDFELPFVSIDDTSAAKYAVEHLIAQGRRRIALINSTSDFKYARNRQNGYLAALSAADIAINKEYIIQLPNMDIELVVSATLQLLNLTSPPDAIFTVSDTYGIGILRACYQAGWSVPNDIAVVSFDNTEFSKMLIPSLTSVNQPRSQLGFMAAELLIEKLTNPSCPNKKILLDTELIVRESSCL